MSPVPVCLVVRHNSPRLSLGRRTSVFCVLQPIIWNMFPDFLLGEISVMSFLMTTRLLSSLYSMQRRASRRLSCSDSQFMPWSMSLTLDLYGCLFVSICTYLIDVAVPFQVFGNGHSEVFGRDYFGEWWSCSLLVDR